MAAGLKSRIADDFAKYGLEIADFVINAITPPEEVQKMIDERSGMGAVGDMGKFVQFKAAKAMEKAAEKGGDASSGMGMGLGAGMGMMMPGMINQAMQDAKKQGGEGGRAGKSKKCPACKLTRPLAAKFCPECGSRVPQGLLLQQLRRGAEEGGQVLPRLRPKNILNRPDRPHRLVV